jgi:hypothetical protein
MQLKKFFRIQYWALLAMLFLTGCSSLKGLGGGLGNLFKNFKLP